MRRHARIPAGLLDNVPAGPVKVLIAVAQHLNVNTHVAQVSLPRLMADTGYSRAQIQRSLRALEALELIQTELGNGRGHVTTYFCPWHLYTVGRQAMSTPGESRERASSTTPFTRGKGLIHEPERASSMSGDSFRSLTDKENKEPPDDPRTEHWRGPASRASGLPQPDEVALRGAAACRRAMREADGARRAAAQ